MGSNQDASLDEVLHQFRSRVAELDTLLADATAADDGRKIDLDRLVAVRREVDLLWDQLADMDGLTVPDRSAFYRGVFPVGASATEMQANVSSLAAVAQKYAALDEVVGQFIRAGRGDRGTRTLSLRQFERLQDFLTTSAFAPMLPLAAPTDPNGPSPDDLAVAYAKMFDNNGDHTSFDETSEFGRFEVAARNRRLHPEKKEEYENTLKAHFHGLNPNIEGLDGARVDAMAQATRKAYQCVGVYEGDPSQDFY